MDKCILQRELIKASKQSNAHIFKALLNVISTQIACKMCSLWEVNTFSNSVSLLAREKHTANAEQDYEYVHELSNSAIGFVLENIKDDELYYEVSDITNSVLYKLHKSRNRVDKLELKKLISIPIKLFNQEKNNYYIHAVVNIYPEEHECFDNDSAQILQDYFIIAFSNNLLLKKQGLTQEILEVYKKKGMKDINSILHPIINQVFRNYFNYEGSSVFIWNPFLNRFNLAQTTGLEDVNSKANVYYSMGEGLTGYCASLGKPQIINNLNDYSNPLIKSEYVHKYREKTAHLGKTLLVFPIRKPSNSDEMIGIIRFTNKINPLAPVLDNFSEFDLDIVSHGCNLIALYMENFQSEQVRTAFTKQLGHEMLAPAVAIKGTVSSLIQKWMNSKFIQTYANDFLKSILNHSELQIAQATTIEFINSGETFVSKATKYHDISKCNLKDDVLVKAKKLVIPLAIDYNVRFDNIYFTGEFPDLFIDKFAFEAVFFNLLTNALKYRKLDNPNLFNVHINCQEFGSYTLPNSEKNQMGYLIKIRDNGIGISENEVEKIFLLGYRKKGIEKTDVRGLGIGLHVVKSILEDFYCSIWVSNFSNPTEFSIFVSERLLDINYKKSASWTK